MVVWIVTWVTPLQAAGLGRAEMVESIIKRNPNAATATDNEGRLPLHYAATVRDGGHIYNLLVEAGADENALDNVSTSSQLTNLHQLHWNEWKDDYVW